MLSKRGEVLTPKSVRNANRAAILQLLRRYRSLSRADLARRSGLTEGSVSRITSGLIRGKLVAEDGAENSTGGRPGTRLCLDERRIGVGIDIRRKSIRMAAVTMSGQIFESIELEAPAAPGECLESITRAVRGFQTKYGTGRVYGAGVSVGGLVNSTTGIVEFGNLPGWIAVSVKDDLYRALKIPIQVDNDVRLAAIAEYHYGKLPETRQSRTLLFVVVDDGVGAGIVLNGQLYSGPGHAAGEFGQMVIADDGGFAKLDRGGCLESLASTTALCKRYASKINKRAFAKNDSRASVRKLCQLALAGDPAALEAFSQTCRYLGIGLANMAWGLNPDAIVIDSPMTEAWQLMVSAIRAEFPTEREIGNFRHLAMRPSSLGGEATMIGAGTLPFQALFDSGEPTDTAKFAKAKV